MFETVRQAYCCKFIIEMPLNLGNHDRLRRKLYQSNLKEKWKGFTDFKESEYHLDSICF